MVWYKTGGSGPAVFGAPLGQASWHGLARYGNCNFKRVELYFLFFDFVHAFHFDVTANSFTVKGDGVRRGKWKSCKWHASRLHDGHKTVPEPHIKVELQPGVAPTNTDWSPKNVGSFSLPLL